MCDRALVRSSIFHENQIIFHVMSLVSRYYKQLLRAVRNALSDLGILYRVSCFTTR